MTASHGVFLAACVLLAAWCVWALFTGLRVIARRRRLGPRPYDWTRDGECDNRSHPRPIL